MGKKDKGTVAETPAEREMMSMALDRYQTYKTKWQPIQARAIEMVKSMNQPGSMERQRAVTQQAGAVGAEFDDATAQVEQGTMSRGVDTDSSNFRLKQATMGIEKGKAQGITAGGAEDAIDNAYVEGLSSLMALGRDQSNQGVRTMVEAAGNAGKNAAVQAGVGATRRARNYGLAGQALGIGATMMGSMGQGNAGGSGSGFGFDGPNKAAEYTPGIDV